MIICCAQSILLFFRKESADQMVRGIEALMQRDDCLLSPFGVTDIAGVREKDKRPLAQLLLKELFILLVLNQVANEIYPRNTYIISHLFDFQSGPDAGSGRNCDYQEAVGPGHSAPAQMLHPGLHIQEHGFIGG